MSLSKPHGECRQLPDKLFFYFLRDIPLGTDEAKLVAAETGHIHTHKGKFTTTVHWS